MRETDERMAKYSRRGLIFNFVAFLICLVGGEFIDQNEDDDFINYRMVEGAEIIGDIEIYDLSAKRMMQKSHEQLNGQIYTGNYAPGFYTLRITTTTGVVTKKFEVISGK